MNKSEFKATLASRLGMTQTATNRMIDTCLEIISENLEAGDPVIFQGFGTFSPWQQTEREGRNPRTGVKCPIRRRTSVKFKPGKFLLERLNNQ